MSKSKRSRKLEGLPLGNITASLNLPIKSKMSYSDDLGFPNLTNSPMSSLAHNLSELSTGRITPRRRLSLSSTDTPNNEDTCSGGLLSAESGCFSGSPQDDSPTLDRLNNKRYSGLLPQDIPLEAFSTKKKTIAYRRIGSQPLPTLRLDSLTDFLDEGTSCDESSSSGSGGFFSPDDASSQDSGLGMDQDKKIQFTSSFDDVQESSPSILTEERLPSLDDVWNSLESKNFKAPKGKPPKRSRSVTEERLFSEDTCSPIKYSPVKSSLPRPSFALSLFTEKSPKQDKAASKTLTDSNDTKSGCDDGFQELFVIEDLQNEADDEVSSLVRAPLLHELHTERRDDGLSFLRRPVAGSAKNKQVKFHLDNLLDSTPSSRPAISRRTLQRSQSLDIRPRMSSKRSEPPEDCSDLVKSCKRFKCEDGDKPLSSSNDVFVPINKVESNSSSLPVIENLPCIRRLHRCHSETEATIKSAVSRMAQEPNLIGDCSKPYCLPLIPGKHQDLKCISGETLSRLLSHEYDNVVEDFYVIDCRYPYEFEGGHIKNALNIYTRDGVLEKFMKSPIALKNPNKRVILIFHCEFSSERGPGLSRFLRRHDRESNKECYPFLHYPEMYLLEGGYKNFFENNDEFCEPRHYRTMLDKNHSDDLRKFRAKSKSWAGEKTHSRHGFRNLKF